MANLTEHEKDKFIEFEDRGGEDMLTPEELILDEQFKNTIVNGVPLDQNHKGIVNLSPLQEEQFLQFESKKEQGKELTKKEKDQLNTLQELLKNGKPVDETHEGSNICLTPL